MDAKTTKLELPKELADCSNLKLIQGVFAQEKAKDVLLTLIDSKVQFHQLNNFSSEIRFGHKDEFSLERIEDLKELKKKLLKILDYAEFHHKKLHIESDIKIWLTDDDKK